MKLITLLTFFCFLFPTQGRCGDKTEVFPTELQKEGFSIIVEWKTIKGERKNQRVGEISFYTHENVTVKRYAEMLSRLSQFQNPEHIDLVFLTLKAQYLESIGKHHQLINKFCSLTIYLSTPPPLLSDKAINNLSKIKNIRAFGASAYKKKMAITVASVEVFSKSKQLHSLALMGTNLSDKDFISLKSLKKLEHLNLSLSKVNGEIVSQLKHNPIKVLGLGGTNIDDKGLSHLKDIKQLERLNLVECRIKGSGLKHLIGLKKLSDLSLSSTLIDGNALVHLLKLPSLKDLTLYNCNISDADIPMLKKFNGLKRLNLTDTKLTPKGIRVLEQALPHTAIEY